MTAPNPQREQVYFRAVGLPADQVEVLRKVLTDLPVESQRRKGKDDFVLAVELSTPVVCDKVRRALASCPLSVPYGIYVSIVTENDSDGVTLAPYVCDFWRQVGGGLDFAFTVV